MWKKSKAKLLRNTGKPSTSPSIRKTEIYIELLERAHGELICRSMLDLSINVRKKEEQTSTTMRFIS